VKIAMNNYSGKNIPKRDFRHKWICFLSLLIMFAPLACYSQEQNNTPFGTEEREDILIAYFSWSGNTSFVAEEIKRQTSGSLFEIIPAEPYPQDFDKTAERWHRERDADARPPITTGVENMDSYRIIFVGYPIWSGDVPAVVRTFLEQYNLSGKTIIPFCTHGGSAFGRSLDRLRRLCPRATITSGFEVYGTRARNCRDDVTQWLRGIRLVQ
jgi:flavodoxin